MFASKDGGYPYGLECLPLASLYSLMFASKAGAISFSTYKCVCPGKPLLPNLIFASKVIRLPLRARVLDHGKTLYPSLMLATKARAFSLGTH